MKSEWRKAQGLARQMLDQAGAELRYKSPTNIVNALRGVIKTQARKYEVDGNREIFFMAQYLLQLGIDPVPESRHS